MEVPSKRVTEFIVTQLRGNLSSMELRQGFDFRFKERLLKYAEEKSGEKARHLTREESVNFSGKNRLQFTLSLADEQSTARSPC